MATKNTKTGVDLIADERRRQIEIERFGAEHDSLAEMGELVRAAVCYAKTAQTNILQIYAGDKPLDFGPPTAWPWGNDWWKPTPNDPVRQLVKAGALIAAEIDRLIAAERSDEADEYEKPIIVDTPSGGKVVLYPAQSSARSCESCAACENGHYCLLHTIGLKNANIICCDDWEEDARSDDHGGEA